MDISGEWHEATLGPIQTVERPSQESTYILHVEVLLNHCPEDSRRSGLGVLPDIELDCCHLDNCLQFWVTMGAEHQDTQEHHFGTL